MPAPHVPNDKIKSGKQLAEWSTELLDSEVQAVMKIVVGIQQKYQYRANTQQNLAALRDETLTKLADVGVLAEVDPSPCFYGEPPVVEIIGKVKTDAIHKEGFDHEHQKYEVIKSKERGEDYLGQKDRVNKRVPKDK